MHDVEVLVGFGGVSLLVSLDIFGRSLWIMVMMVVEKLRREVEALRTVREVTWWT